MSPCVPHEGWKRLPQLRATTNRGHAEQ